MVHDKSYSIGENIKKRRKNLGMSQEKLAEMSKLSTNYISRIERSSTANLSVSVLVAISEALDTDINNLIYSDKKPVTSYNVEKLNSQLAELDSEQADEIGKLLLKLINELKK
ncbi:helix-turn-helix transcriptional regulator [Lactobacillus sp. YT155]|uniref:helix-turn-helix domain-containing protein n=1 Tax=Lactobacillus sp. YT155 TaxID=3060955 RepID=UPI00265EA453|nr:helix-turn-helix transcriptional regulator [Lactobacillus sp. YT155]MDO1604721.1 helix-turn-helix transcriptional regulator [Lactobacillus sp. YT155]